MMDNELTYRLANDNDVDLYYKWAIDPEVRSNSFSKKEIKFSDHVKWFNNKIQTFDAVLFVFYCGAEPVGQLRIDYIGQNVAEIGYSVAKEWRGKRFGCFFLTSIKDLLIKVNPALRLKGIIEVDNIASVKSFRAAGFIEDKQEVLNHIKCHIFYSR